MITEELEKEGLKMARATVIINALQETLEKAMKIGGKFNYDDETLVKKVREIFKIEEDELSNENLKEDIRFECYKKMIEKLDSIEKPADKAEYSVKKELNEHGLLLREAWRKHEDKLRVHKHEAKEGEAYCDYENENGVEVYGVYINLEYAMKENLDWIAAYHYIFHEFFHIVFGAAVKDVRLDDIMLEFGRSIANDVNKLLEEEKGNAIATKKRLNNLTYRTNERHKAVLYDLIGAVLYRGKYGCYPPNSEFYNDGKKCKNEKGCKLETNTKCNKIFGHNIDKDGNKYWGEKTSAPTPKFLQKLALEAFANIAAEAIVNQKAFEKIKEYLPESCKMFKKILKEILSEELKFLRNLWLN